MLHSLDIFIVFFVELIFILFFFLLKTRFHLKPLKFLVDLIKVSSKKTEIFISFLIGAGFSVTITLAFGIDLSTRSFLGMIHSMLVAPIFEELFFRGMLLGYLIFQVERLCKNQEILKYFFLTSSVLFSAFVFALLHSSLNWSIFISGIIYGLLYVWRKSVSLPIVAHFGYNLVIWAFFTFYL